MRYRLLLIAALAVGAGWATLPVPASAQSAAAGAAAATDSSLPGPGGWTLYVNSRFGTRVTIPTEVFAPQAASADGDGRRFLASDAELEVFGWQREGNETPVTLQKRLLGMKGYDRVTYTRTGGRWLVLSGFREGKIFYEKYFLRPTTIQAFGVEFPPARKPVYAPLIERMENSFRAG